MPNRHNSCPTLLPRRSAVLATIGLLSLFAGHDADGGPVDTVFIVERSGIFNGAPAQVGSFPSNGPASVAVLGGSSPPPVFYGMDADPQTGVLYGIGRLPGVTTGSLFVIDGNTGVASLVGTPNTVDLAPGNLGGLTFNLSGTVLYGTDSVDLFAVDTFSGVKLTGSQLQVGGQAPTFQLAGLAVAPAGVPAVPQHTLIGLAVYPTFPLPLRLPEIVTFTIVGGIAEVTTLTVVDVVDPAFGVVAFSDQGLDFNAAGVLYACLIGVASPGTLFDISLQTGPTLGQAALIGRVGTANPTTWWAPGAIAVGGAAPIMCATCPGDVSGDGLVDALDLQPWLDAALAFATNGQIPPGGACADMDGDGAISIGTPSDLTLFTQRLLNGPPTCP